MVPCGSALLRSTPQCIIQVEDRYEFARIIFSLVRLRHRQGDAVIERAVNEAARLDWRFCENCGSEESHQGDLCSGCGRSTNRRLGNAQAAP